MTRSSSSGAQAPLTTTQLLAFGFPALTHSFVAMPLYAILPTFYAANTAVTLAQIGMIAAFSRIIDAVNDPIIGHWSDRTRSRFGSRKPWMVGAIFFCMISIANLFSPPSTATWLYFLIWSQILYTGFTMFEVPRSAWSVEVSRDYDERAKVGTFVALFNIGGSLLFFGYPIIASFFTGSAEITSATLKAISIIYLVLMPIGVIASLILVPVGHREETKPAAFGDVFKSIIALKPLRLFYSITTIWGLGQGVVVGVAFIFYTGYMGLSAYYPYIMVTLFLSEIVFLPIWTRILRRFDRHRVWAATIALAACMSPIVLLLPRGPEALVPVFCLIVVRGFFSAPANFLPSAVLGDVIDYDTLKTGQNKAGNLFAAQMVLIKIAMAIGGALAFLVLDRVGYKVGQVNDAAANAGLLAAYIGIPVTMHLTMAAVCWNFPINRRRHGVIKRRLEGRARSARANAGLKEPRGFGQPADATS